MTKIIIHLDNNDVKLMPIKATENSAGFDLKAAIPQTVVINPGECHKIPNGIITEIPPQHVGLILARSSLAFKGIILTNSVGVIDSDYRGPINTLLSNVSNIPFHINPYERIGQILFIRLADFALIISYDEPTKTNRNDGGFGSTGK